METQARTQPKMCDAHGDLMTNIALSQKIVDTIPGLFQRLDEHVLGEGHPLLTQQLSYMRQENDRKQLVLERLVESVTKACVNIQQLQDNQVKLFDRQHELEQKQEVSAVAAASETVVNANNWKLMAALGTFALANIATLIWTLLKMSSAIAH